MEIRLIQPKDNAAIKSIVQLVLKSFGADREGFAWADPELDDMHKAYSLPGTKYWVIEEAGKVLGGGGIGFLKNGTNEWCELQKMYFLPEARGKGWGSLMMKRCLAFASTHYKFCYLETLKSMTTAQSLYKKFGFEKVDTPKGDTGHSGCDVWMVKKLA